MTYVVALDAFGHIDRRRFAIYNSTAWLPSNARHGRRSIASQSRWLLTQIVTAAYQHATCGKWLAQDNRFDLLHNLEMFISCQIAATRLAISSISL